MGSNDAQDLSKFGYAQELFRSMGGFSNFAISFSTISILTGVATLYGYGLEMGGPFEMTVGWPLATLFTMAIAASMAELCSAYPTSGAMYHWATALAGPATGWFVAWLNIIGGVAAGSYALKSELGGGSTRTPQQIAQLRWYDANLLGATFPVDPESGASAPSIA